MIISPTIKQMISAAENRHEEYVEVRKVAEELLIGGNQKLPKRTVCIGTGQ